MNSVFKNKLVSLLLIGSMCSAFFYLSCGHGGGKKENNVPNAPTSTICITKIICGKEEKLEEECSLNMSFNDVYKTFIDVKVETSDKDIKVEFIGLGEVKSDGVWNWALVSGKNLLKVRLIKGEESKEYEVSIKSKLKTIPGKYQLNGRGVFDIDEGEFESKIIHGENPVFDSPFNHFIMLFLTQFDYGKFLINKKEYEKPKGKQFKSSEILFKLDEGEHQFEIFISPDTSFIDQYACKYHRFRVTSHANKAQVNPVIKINGMSNLPEDFLSNLDKDGTLPLYKVFKGPAIVEIEIPKWQRENFISDVKINGVLENLPKNKAYIDKEFELEGEKPVSVKIEFLAKDEALHNNLIWNFQLQEGGEKPPIMYTGLLGINDVGTLMGELPDSFMSHLIDKSNPLYEFDGENAKVTLFDESNGIVKHATFKIDGTIKNTVVPLEDDELGMIIPYEYEIKDNDVHNIEIEIVPNESEEYSPLILNFKLKKSGKKKTMFANKMEMSINSVEDYLMNKEIRDHLLDGSSPLYEIDGCELDVNLKIYNSVVVERIGRVLFKFADETAKEINLEKCGNSSMPVWLAFSKFILKEANVSYPLKIEIVPKDPNMYETVVYSLNIKTSALQIQLPVRFGVDSSFYPSDMEISVSKDKVEIFARSEYDVMERVSVVQENGDNLECPIKMITDNNKTYYEV